MPICVVSTSAGLAISHQRRDALRSDVCLSLMHCLCVFHVVAASANDMTGLKESDEKLKQQQQESARRENILVMRLATKEQEMQECTVCILIPQFLQELVVIHMAGHAALMVTHRCCPLTFRACLHTRSLSVNENRSCFRQFIRLKKDNHYFSWAVAILLSTFNFNIIVAVFIAA